MISFPYALECSYCNATHEPIDISFDGIEATWEPNCVGCGRKNEINFHVAEDGRNLQPAEISQTQS